MSMGMCGYAWTCMCHSLCVEVRGQHVGVDSFPPPHSGNWIWVVGSDWKCLSPPRLPISPSGFLNSCSLLFYQQTLLKYMQNPPISWIITATTLVQGSIHHPKCSFCFSLEFMVCSPHDAKWPIKSSVRLWHSSAQNSPCHPSKGQVPNKVAQGPIKSHPLKAADSCPRASTFQNLNLVWAMDSSTLRPMDSSGV